MVNNYVHPYILYVYLILTIFISTKKKYLGFPSDIIKLNTMLLNTKVPTQC